MSCCKETRKEHRYFSPFARDKTGVGAYGLRAYQLHLILRAGPTESLRLCHLSLTACVWRLLFQHSVAYMALLLYCYSRVPRLFIRFATQAKALFMLPRLIACQSMNTAA